MHEIIVDSVAFLIRMCIVQRVVVGLDVSRNGMKLNMCAIKSVYKESFPLRDKTSTDQLSLYNNFGIIFKLHKCLLIRSSY